MERFKLVMLALAVICGCATCWLVFMLWLIWHFQTFGDPVTPAGQIAFDARLKAAQPWALLATAVWLTVLVLSLRRLLLRHQP